MAVLHWDEQFVVISHQRYLEESVGQLTANLSSASQLTANLSSAGQLTANQRSKDQVTANERSEAQLAANERSEDELKADERPEDKPTVNERPENQITANEWSEVQLTANKRCEDGLTAHQKPLNTSALFNIRTVFRMDNEAKALTDRMVSQTSDITSRKRKKRKKSPEEEDTAASLVRQVFEASTTTLMELFCAGTSSVEEIRENNLALRLHVAQVMADTDREFSIFCDSGLMAACGGNPGNDYHVEHGVIFPPQCRYINSSIDDMKLDGEFDIILMDPPWENKHVKRKRNSELGYSMLPNSRIQQLPVSRLLAAGGLVLVWCSTNSRHQAAIRDWFQEWGVEPVATWYWLKLTVYGEPVCDFRQSGGKRPYELIIIGRKIGHQEKTPGIPQHLVLLSTPSGIHSHKPPLSSLLDKLTTNHRRRLEIFGRYLQENWTTVGLESWKLSHVSVLQNPTV